MTEECPEHVMDADEMFVSIPYQDGIKKVIGTCAVCKHVAYTFVAYV